MSGLNISFKISAIDDFSTVMRKLQSNLESVSQATQEIGATVTAFGAAMSVAVGAVAKFGIEFNARMEQSKIAWETLLKSTDKATEMQQNLQKLAETSPFDYEGLDKTAKMMLAMGWNAESLLPDIKSIGDAVSAVGGGTDALERVGLAFAQMSAKGKISAEEMNQLAENGIPAWQILAQETGKSVQELMKMSENGKLFANETIPLIMRGMQEKFGGSMEKASNTFTGQLERMKEVMNKTFGTLTLPLFEMLKNVLPAISSGLENVAKWFSGLSKPMQLTLTALAVLVPLFTLLGGVILLAVGAIGNAIAGFGAIAGALGMTAGALAGIIGIAAGVVAGIVALGAAFVIAYQKVDWFRNFVNQAWAQIKAYFQTALTFISGIVSQVMSVVSAFISEKLAQIRAFWQENGSMILQATQNVWNVIKAVISSVMGVITAIMKTTWPIIRALIESVWSAIKGVINGALNVIMGVIKAFSALLTGNWRKLWEGVKQFLVGTLQLIWNAISLAFMGRIISVFKLFASGAKAIITSLWTAIKSIFTGALNAIKSAVTTYFNFIKNTVTTSMNGVKAVISAVWNAIKSVVTNGMSTVKNAVSNGMNAVKSKITSVWNSVISFLKGIDLSKIGRNIIQGLINGMTSMVGSLMDKARSIANSVTSTIKKALDIHSPSRVMMELGQFTGEGFAIGLDKTLRNIHVSADKLAYAAVPNVEPSGYRTGVSTTVQQPINITLNYNGSGSPSDAYQMVDILERELGNRINSRLRFSGVRL
jgi:tape measure domain-containing protein